MPKIKSKITNSFLLIVILLSVTAVAKAATFNNYKIPAKTGYEAFNESFTSTTFPPPGWDTLNFFGNYVTWYRRTNNPNTAPACAATNASGPLDPYHANEWLISPRIRAYPFDTLFFWYRSNDNSNNETVFVRLSKYPDQHDTSYYYIYGKVITANNNNQWYRDTVPLSAITNVFGESCYIAIQHYRAGDRTKGINIDDIVVRSYPIYIIVSSAGPGGSIYPLDTSYVNQGDSLKFTITPNSGYVVDSVIVDGSYVGNVSSYTFYNVNANHTIRATFRQTPLQIFINDVSANEGHTGTTAFNFSVYLNKQNSTTVTVNYATVDGTASTSDNDYNSASGTVTFVAGDTIETITVYVNGDYKYEPDETFYVLLSNPTGNAEFGDSVGVGTILNDDNQPSISISDTTGYEGDVGTTSFGFYVTLSNASADTVKVDYTTTDNTAEDENGDNDYASTSGTLTFNPGETVKRIGVDVNGDLKYEPDETFYVNLSNPVNATISDNQGLGTILNDDGQPSIAISDTTGYEGNSGTTSFGFYVSLSNPSYQTITVDYTTTDNTAEDENGDGDYTSTSGTSTFNPGETVKRIGVNVNGDYKYEPDETFYVDLSNTVNATISDGLGLGTILNDNSVPEISISDSTGYEGDTFGFYVSLSNPSADTIKVDYATSDGSAMVSDNDYLLTTGTMIFNPGETSKRIGVKIYDDNKYEPDETFYVNLSNPINATISDNLGLGTILNDDNQPTIAISDAADTEGNVGSKDFAFNVTLSNPSYETVTVDYTTSDGSATVSDNDYAPASGTITFHAGDTLELIVITVHGDYKYETDETFFVDLTNANNASISDSQGLGTILNDDTVYTLTINIVGNGTVSKNPDLPYYEFGTWVYLQAIPDPGWGFVGYGGDLIGSNPYDSIYIDADKNVTATFGQVIRDVEVYDIILPSDDTTVTVCTPFQPKVDIKNNTVPAIAELCTVEVHIWGYRIQMDSFCSVSINPNDSVLLYADTVITTVDPGHNLITMTKSWHPYTADITWIANPTHHTVHARVKMADDAVPANDFRQESFIVNGQTRDLQMNYVGLLKGKEVIRNDTIFMNNVYNTVSVIANPMGPNAVVRIFYKIIKVNSNITLYSRYLDKTILAGSYMCLSFQTGWVPPDTGWYKLISYIVVRPGVDVNSRNDTVVRYIYTKRLTLLAGNSNTINSAQSELTTILPTTFALQQNYPNPLRNRTTIQWQIPIASKVTLSIYDATGRNIKTLVDNTFAPGYYTITWDGTDNNNQKVPAGIYFYEMQTDKFTARRKLIITN